MLAHALHDLLQRLDNVARQAGRPSPRLLAVSKFQSATAVAELAAAWRRERPGEVPAFGENYVQEAQAKQAALSDPGLEWHLVGHLQSNKAREAAALFDWVQSVDRAKLVAALAAHRDPVRAPLNVLVQVNIDDESSKHGCRPDDVPATEVVVLHDPDAKKALVLLFFDNEEDYRRGDAALNAMPPGDTPGQRTSVTRYEVAFRMTD